MACKELYGETTPCESCSRVGEEDLSAECRIAYRSWVQITMLERRSGFGVEPLGYMTMKQICFEQGISQEVFDFMLLIETEFLRIKREASASDKEKEKQKQPSKKRGKK